MEVSCTLPDWLESGTSLVGAGVTAVRLVDRHPESFRDRLSPRGAFGWQFGRRWLDPEMPSWRWTVPEEIFMHLPDCPVPEVVAGRVLGAGIRPRWPTADEAHGALSAAAIAWAGCRCGDHRPEPR
jgi:hypothetical protein